MDINRNFHFQCCNRISTDIRRFAIAKCEPGLKSTWSSLPTVPCLARLRRRLFALDSNYSARSELQECEALYPHGRINGISFLTLQTADSYSLTQPSGKSRSDWRSRPARICQARPQRQFDARQERSTERIDGIVAGLIAMARAIRNGSGGSVY